MSKTYLQITCRTWKGDSSLLFDYKSKDYHQDTMKIPKTGSLALCSNSDQTHLEGSLNNQVILKISKMGDDYLIFPLKNYPVGEVIGKLNRNRKLGTLLTESDIFKLGRIFFKVKELKIGSFNRESFDLVEKLMKDENFCRICFSYCQSTRNPLVSVCACMGSMKYTHLLCLQQWVLSKSKISKSRFSESYKWSSFTCDVCKEDLPLTVSHKGTDFEILKLPKPYKNYIVLEEITNEAKGMNFHVLHTDEIPILIGRSHYCEVIIKDQSISQIHASIELENNKFYIKDNHSRFGTVFMLYKPIVLKQFQEEFLQINNTFIVLSVWSTRGIKECFGMCFKRSEEAIIYPDEVYWNVDN